MNLDRMLFLAVVVALISSRARRVDASSFGWYYLGVSAILLGMSYGLYWNIFGRGHGFFTANRVSAFVALIAILFMPGRPRQRR